ncbi:MAG: pilus assembly protein N-terminal domain-containing protein, partial [Armatimonadota bacterium]|nr:pilus assembly protein N-terminal domain-containing protein [Armatimonadota bacterium]
MRREKRATWKWMPGLAVLLLVGGVSGEGATPSPMLLLTAGRPLVLSVRGAREVQVVNAEGRLEAEMVSPTALRLTAGAPGEGCLRVRTAAGWQTYRFRAAAAGRRGQVWVAGAREVSAARGAAVPLSPVAAPQRLAVPPARTEGGRPALSFGPHPLAPTVLTIVGLPDPPRLGELRQGVLVAEGVSGAAPAQRPQTIGTGGTGVLRLQPPAEPAVAPPIAITLAEGRSRIIPADGLRTVQVDDASGAVADVQPISDSEVLLLAKGPGSTMLRVWDRRGRTEYEVTVTPGPERQQKMIQEAINAQGVTVRLVEGAAILEGEVPDVEQLARAQRIAEAFVPKVINLLRTPLPPVPARPEPNAAELVQAVLPAGEVRAEMLPGNPSVVVLRGLAPRVEDLRSIEEVAKSVAQKANATVVNLIQLAQPRQVRVQARLLNVDQRFLKDLGIRWNEDAMWGQAVAGGEFKMLTAIQADLRALGEDTRIEVLAQPSIVVNSGAVGHITIGGEVPIPNVVTGLATAGQTGVGTVGQSVIFRPFGVQLGIEPVVEPGDEITLRLVAEASSIDRNTSVVINGANIPGFTTKRAATEVRLTAGQTLVIGGLISREDNEVVRKFPILADIPVFGSFFRSVRRDKQTRELVLFLTLE